MLLLLLLLLLLLHTGSGPRWHFYQEDLFIVVFFFLTFGGFLLFAHPKTQVAGEQGITIGVWSFFFNGLESMENTNTIHTIWKSMNMDIDRGGGHRKKKPFQWLLAQYIGCNQ